MDRALANDLGITGTPGFIVGTELVPWALGLNELKELNAQEGTGNDGKTFSKQIPLSSGDIFHKRRTR